ncbi:MAG: UrcA family protein [Pseudomonadales bacterium]|nr:UrcA family protein [Pseudomonadales bacterium]
MKKLLIAVSCLALSIGANISISNAAVFDSVIVNIKDINLATESGQEKLHQRITHAAKSVCGSTIRSEVSSLYELMQNRSCVEQAIAKGMSDSGVNVATR